MRLALSNDALKTIGSATCAATGDFSQVIKASGRYVTHGILFDTGMTPSGLVENMRRFGHSPKDIEAIVLSHGHFDHFGGATRIHAETGADILTHESFRPAWSRAELDEPYADVRRENHEVALLFGRQGLTVSDTDRAEQPRRLDDRK